MRRVWMIALCCGLVLAVGVEVASAPAPARARHRERVRVKVRKRVRVRLYGPRRSAHATYYAGGGGSPGSCGYGVTGPKGVRWGVVARGWGSAGLPCGARIHVLSPLYLHGRPHRDFLVGDRCPGCGAGNLDVFRPCGCGWTNPTVTYRTYRYGWRWRWRRAWRWRWVG